MTEELIISRIFSLLLKKFQHPFNQLTNQFRYAERNYFHFNRTISWWKNKHHKTSESKYLLPNQLSLRKYRHI